MTRADIASSLEYSSTSGTFLKLLATLRGFGLLEKEARKQLKITDLAIRLKNADLTLRTGQELAMESIRSSPVFAKLLERFPEKVPPQHSLARHLEEDMGFSERKAEEAAKVLVESLESALVLDPQRNIVLRPEHGSANVELPLSEDVVGEQLHGDQATQQSLTSRGGKSAEGTTDIPLTRGRFVRLRYPSDLTPDEAKRVGAILELLAGGSNQTAGE
jgi:hypothetical protein